MSRCPKSDAAANAGDMDNLYKVSADFEMKLTAAQAEIVELRATIKENIATIKTLSEQVGAASELRAKCERLEADLRTAYREAMGGKIHPMDALEAILAKSANPGGAHE